MGDDSDVTSSVSSASHPTPADNVDCKLYSPLQFVDFTEFKQLSAHTPPLRVIYDLFRRRQS